MNIIISLHVQKYNIISILLLGNKFVPNYSFNKRQFFNFLLHNLDLNFIKFDNFLNISKANFLKDTEDNYNIDDNSEHIEDNHFKKIFKEISKKCKNITKKDKNFFNVETC